MMATRLVETQLPIHCTWCGKPLHAFLDVPTSGNTSDGSVILCRECDSFTLPIVRQRVVSVGHLEKRDDVYVWVEGLHPHDPARKRRRAAHSTRRSTNKDEERASDRG